MPTNDELLNPKLTGAEYYARIRALHQAEALLDVWAALFTDNCSEQSDRDLYEHYASFVNLFGGIGGLGGRRGGMIQPFPAFQEFVRKNSPMGFHDSEDTDVLIYSLARAHRYSYPGEAYPEDFQHPEYVPPPPGYPRVPE